MMVTVVVEFSTFISSGDGRAWADESNAQTNNSVYATCDIPATDETKLLIGTGLDLSSVPTSAILTSVRLIVETSVTGFSLDRLTEVFAWDGGKVVGKNQITDPGPQLAFNNDTDISAGKGDWGFWNILKLRDSTNGVAIRFERFDGVEGQTIRVDYMRLEIAFKIQSGRGLRDSSGYLAAQHFGLVSP